MKKVLLLLIPLTACASLFESPTSPTTDISTDTNTSTGPTNTSSKGYTDEVIRLANIERRSSKSCGPGGSPVSKDSSLTTAAQDHSEDMNENNYFSHTGRDGSTIVDRARRAGYNSGFVGENIANGQRTPSEVMQSWMASPGHCANIMRAEYNDIGVGYANSVWVMVLGRG